MRNWNTGANLPLLIVCLAALLLTGMTCKLVDRYNELHRPQVIVNAEILTK